MIHASFIDRIGAELAHLDDAYERAVALRPEDKRLWIACGRHFARLGQIDKAVAAYARGVDPVKPGGLKPSCPRRHVSFLWKHYELFGASRSWKGLARRRLVVS